MRDGLHSRLARESIVEQVLAGKFKPGVFSEAALAEELRLSRTPVREALLTLPLFFSRSDHRGFQLRPMDAREVREIYPMIGALECLGLDFHVDELMQADFVELRKLNDRFRAAKKPAVAVDADSEWHTKLLSKCRNQSLLRVLSDLKLVARRYDLAFMGRPSLLAQSANQHESIVLSLERRNLAETKVLLLDNWMSGCEALAQVLQWR